MSDPTPHNVDALANRQEQIAANARDIRDAALASEDGDGMLWVLLSVENEEKAQALLDAAAQVRRDIRLEQAVAQAHIAARLQEVTEARVRLAGYDRQLAVIEERVVRPVCDRLGQGTTRVVKTGLVRVAIHKMPARVEIRDPDIVQLLPDRYRRVKVEADKTALKAALEAGESIPGVELVHETRVDWK